MRKQSNAAVLAIAGLTAAIAVAGCAGGYQSVAVGPSRFDLAMRSTELAPLPDAERSRVASVVANAPDRLIPAVAATISRCTYDARLAVPSNPSGILNDDQMSLWHACMSAQATAANAREHPAPVHLPTLWD